MKRILSIDGGGIRGVFAAAFLAEIEKDIEGSIGDYFDLIAGTSTGGIIAIGLAMGISAGEIVDFYETYGPKIFKGNRFLRFARRAIHAKYDTDSLREALEKLLGDIKLGDARTRLLVPSQIAESGDIYIFKTPHHPDYRKDWQRSAVDVALATSAAPTFFPTSSFHRGPEMVDGGLWANNPVCVACVEAIGRRLNWSPSDLWVLSIGTANSPRGKSFFRAHGMTGLLGSAWPTLDLMLRGQSHGALGLVSNLGLQVERIDPVVGSGRMPMDDPSNIPFFISLGHQQARDRGNGIIREFEGKRADPFKPCYPADGRGSAQGPPSPA